MIYPLNKYLLSFYYVPGTAAYVLVHSYVHHSGQNSFGHTNLTF